jgi:hypothetical protein
LYAYADSWDTTSTPNGAVVETNETNNRTELGGLTVTGTNPPLPSSYDTELPPRPDLGDE